MESYSFREKKDSSTRVLHYKITAILAAVIICVIAVGSLLLPDRAFSDEENRSLAQAPELTSAALKNGSYFTDLDTYLQDQIIGRDGWVRMKTTELRSTGVKESNDVYFGKNGYLLDPPVEPDQEKMDRSIAQIRAFQEKYPDMTMCMTLVPCAAAVFPELLPAGAPVRDQLEDIAYVRARIVDWMPFVEMQTAFRNDSLNQIYYRTDHHWTSRGALDAFQAMHWDMGIDSVEYYIPMTVTTDFEGTLASQSGSHVQKDTIEIYRPENEFYQYYTYYPDSQERIPSLFITEKLEEKDKYQVFFGGNHALLTVRTTVDSDRNLLIFKDSYANSFVQFLLPYYGKIVLVDPRYYYDDISTLITSEAITDVLFLYSMNTFAEDGSLADVLSQATEAAAEPAPLTEETPADGAAEEAPADGAAEETPQTDAQPAEEVPQTDVQEMQPAEEVPQTDSPEAQPADGMAEEIPQVGEQVQMTEDAA